MVDSMDSSAIGHPFTSARNEASSREQEGQLWMQRCTNACTDSMSYRQRLQQNGLRAIERYAGVPSEASTVDSLENMLEDSTHSRMESLSDPAPQCFYVVQTSQVVQSQCLQWDTTLPPDGQDMSSSKLDQHDYAEGHRLGAVEWPSIGSWCHNLGSCKPCVFVNKMGCGNGAQCPFCHLCEPGEKERRKKEKRINLSSGTSHRIALRAEGQSAPTTPQTFANVPTKLETEKAGTYLKLPDERWKVAGDQVPEHNWHRERDEVTWSSRAKQGEEVSPTSTTKAVNKSEEEKVDACTNSTSPNDSTNSISRIAPTMRSYASTGAVEYLVVQSWVPSEDDKSRGRCIRVTHGERVVLESETLDGWGVGSVILEAGESVRQGRFPMKVLSDNPVAGPKKFSEGAHVKVIDEFIAPASGYLSTSMGEMLVAKYHAEPFIWVWAQAAQDSTRSGWVPEAVLVMT